MTKKRKAMNEKVYATLKSADTEDWVDYHIVRPFSYYWAVFFAKLGIHPNTVTIASMIIGAASAFFFAHGCFHYEGGTGLLYNLLAFLLLFIADILDNTDGQLARMTNKRSALGRILDGMAGYAWYVPIYIALVYRFYVHHDIEFSLLGLSDTTTTVTIATIIVFVMATISGLLGIAPQQRIADYYIQAHLFFLKGEKGSELDNVARQKELLDQIPEKGHFWQRLVQRSYVDYTYQQERVTPQFQRLLSALRKRYGDTANFPESVREEFCRYSKPTLNYVFMLIFNFRTSYLLLFCLLDIPVATFFFEAIVVTLIMRYTIRRHEAFCSRMADEIEKS